jgi:hypothetical protein
MQADKLLTAHGFIFSLIPTPKEISSDCGLCVRIDPDRAGISDVEKILSENDISYQVFNKEYL